MRRNEPGITTLYITAAVYMKEINKNTPIFVYIAILRTRAVSYVGEKMYEINSFLQT